MFSKFEATARAIEALQPEVFLPSAGPPCFLDPQLFHINFEPINIFPRNAQLIDFFWERLKLNERILPPAPSEGGDVSKEIHSKEENGNIALFESKDKLTEKFFAKQKISPFGGGWGEEHSTFPT